MPNYETIPTNRTGHGPPKPDLGTIGDKYTDQLTGEVWAKRKTGWTNRTRLEIHPTIRQKSAWVTAAEKRGQNLEAWVTTTLDAAVPDAEPAIKHVADLKAGDWFKDIVTEKVWKITEMGDPYAKLVDQSGKSGSVHIGRVVFPILDPSSAAGTDVPAEGN